MNRKDIKNKIIQHKTNVALGKSLKEARIEAKVSKEAFAETLKQPVRFIERMEAGDLVISTYDIMQLCKAHNLNTDEIFKKAEMPEDHDREYTDRELMFALLFLLPNHSIVADIDFGSMTDTEALEAMMKKVWRMPNHNRAHLGVK